MAERRKFSEEDKLKVLMEAGEHGVSNVLRQYNISYSIFARWIKMFLIKGLDPFSTTTGNKALLEENIRLKKIIAEQALSLEMKDEELRRLHARFEKRIS